MAKLAHRIGPTPGGERVALALAAALVVAAPFFPSSAPGASVAGCSKKASAEGKKSYTTKGTIKSFGPDKKYVNIAHEDIPGYMAAMTMSFEPEKPALLEGIAQGDRVTFTFVDDNGRRVITDVKKSP